MTSHKLTPLQIAQIQLELASQWRANPSLSIGPETATASAAVAQAAALVSIAESMKKISDKLGGR